MDPLTSEGRRNLVPKSSSDDALATTWNGFSSSPISFGLHLPSPDLTSINYKTTGEGQSPAFEPLDRPQVDFSSAPHLSSFANGPSPSSSPSSFSFLSMLSSMHTEPRDIPQAAEVWDHGLAESPLTRVQQQQQSPKRIRSISLNEARGAREEGPYLSSSPLGTSPQFSWGSNMVSRFAAADQDDDETEPTGLHGLEPEKDNVYVESLTSPNPRSAPPGDGSPSPTTHRPICNNVPVKTSSNTEAVPLLASSSSSFTSSASFFVDNGNHKEEVHASEKHHPRGRSVSAMANRNSSHTQEPSSSSPSPSEASKKQHQKPVKKKMSLQELQKPTNEVVPVAPPAVVGIDADASYVLWIGNVGVNITEKDLRDMFGPYGNILHMRVLHDRFCAFITYETLESSCNAKRALSGAPLGTQNILINYRQVVDKTSQVPMKDPTVTNPPSNSLWVGNVNEGVEEEELAMEFNKYGVVESVKILRNCAFVNYYNVEDAISALDALQGTLFAGMNLKINFGKPRSPMPMGSPYTPPSPMSPSGLIPGILSTSPSSGFGRHLGSNNSSGDQIPIEGMHNLSLNHNHNLNHNLNLPHNGSPGSIAAMYANVHASQSSKPISIPMTAPMTINPPHSSPIHVNNNNSNNFNNNNNTNTNVNNENGHNNHQHQHGLQKNTSGGVGSAPSFSSFGSWDMVDYNNSNNNSGQFSPFMPSPTTSSPFLSGGGFGVGLSTSPSILSPLNNPGFLSQQQQQQRSGASSLGVSCNRCSGYCDNAAVRLQPCLHVLCASCFSQAQRSAVFSFETPTVSCLVCNCAIMSIQPALAFQPR